MACPSIHSGHRQRLRQRALQTSLENMPPHEVMELLLTYAIPVRDVNELAHSLVNQFGSVGKVLHASVDELVQVPGIGRSTAEFLLLMGNIIDEYSTRSCQKRPIFQRAVALIEVLRQELHLAGLYLVCLDAHTHLQSILPLTLSDFSPNAVAQAMLQTAILRQAYNLVLVHFETGELTEKDARILQEFIHISSGVDVFCMDILFLHPDGHTASLRAQQKDSPMMRMQDGSCESMSFWIDAFPHWLDAWPHMHL